MNQYQKNISYKLNKKQLKMKTLVLLAIIVLNAVQCVETPSWISQSDLQTTLACVSALKIPDCIATTCTDAAVAYSTCIFCSSNIDSFNSYLSCTKACATTYINDPTTKDDITVGIYANGYTSCIQAINPINTINGSSILVLSAFLLAVLALLF
ncbi:transmembrane protein, putative (macronuclear) [Tetrahymena thermophila SB210]|uniref:Transmembrane protein, putative n=1 Tax=Tetrahymena thermophila (strain SB210) TaxID=312017 RepID=Q22NK0_TETTS|nr:transmembrane protein, putative [Tetrahymena thermophila SB210]EAR86785.2 transmembrane protein, putative [Tetrahymena thermophila SB210]|eukprot:XP_001007030.2 transmembrane protein, putative [Tetrahymena thermophila SB210]